MSETLEINKAAALKVYQNTSPEIRTMLESLFGKETFNQKITDRVKTFSDALAVVGASNNLQMLLDYNGIDEVFIAAKAWAKATIICKALNEGWVPDWNNSSEYKYYPWFKMNTGSGLSYGDYAYDLSSSRVGSRLVFKSSELAKYAGEQFLDIYKEFMTI